MHRLVLVGLSLAPCSLGAAEFTWCVAPDQALATACGAEQCSNEEDFATFSEAVAWIEQHHGDELGAEHTLCGRSQAPVVDAVVLDNRSGGLGASTSIAFQGTFPCPPSAAEPVLTVRGGVGASHLQVLLEGVGLGTPPCLGASDFVVDSDGADVELRNSWLREREAVELSVAGGDLHVASVLVEGAGILSLNSDGDLALVESELASSAAASGASALSVGGLLTIEHSAVFGLASDGAPLLQAEGGVSIRGSFVGGNAVRGSALMEFSARDLVLGEATIETSTFSRNSIAAGGSANPAPTESARPEVQVGPQYFCLPSASQQLPFWSRTAGEVQGASGPGSLLRVTAGSGQLPHLAVVKSFVVDNQIGGGGLFSHAAGEQTVELSLIHNTVSGDGTFASVEDGGRFALHAARNVWVGPRAPSEAVFQSVEWTMDAFFPDGGPDADPGLDGLVGPFLSPSYSRGGSWLLRSRRRRSTGRCRAQLPLSPRGAGRRRQHWLGR